jgi:ADP-heptose:LPS heptosyltransferase
MRESFLVVNLNQVGAVVLSLPVFAALRWAFPQAFLATLVREANDTPFRRQSLH